MPSYQGAKCLVDLTAMNCTQKSTIATTVTLATNGWKVGVMTQPVNIALTDL